MLKRIQWWWRRKRESEEVGDDVEEEGAATDLVEDFGAFAFEPRAFARGHDGDGEVVGVHRSIWSHGRCLRQRT